MDLKLSSIKVKIDNFEGPLDLLLHLVITNEMDISNINIQEIIDIYIAYIEEFKKDNLGMKVEFLLMASRLLAIKSKSVLNKKEPIDEEAELQKQLIEYKKYKDLSQALEEMENSYIRSYTKKGKEVMYQLEEEYSFERLNLENIFNSYISLLKEDKKIEFDLNLDKSYSLEEGLEELESRLKRKKELFFHEVLENDFSRTKLVIYFLAILELYKMNKITITNEKEIGIRYMEG